MPALAAVLERKLAALDQPVAFELPGGRRLGAPAAAVRLKLHELRQIVHVARGQIGKVAEAYVEGRIDFDGSVRELMTVASGIIGTDPTGSDRLAPLQWGRVLLHELRSRWQHRPGREAGAIEFHYDVSDDFYALWLDPRRVYSCAYFADPSMTLAQAQEAKLDHICRKLMLREGERLLDIGAGWGGLLLWAAEHYGVRAHGITLSRNQHAHVQKLVEGRGLGSRVTIELRDYRDLPEDEPWDKIASVGMFEHVGRARLPEYFAKVRSLLRPGGLLMNHGITAGGTRNLGLGGGIGGFVERYIFPGGELLHSSHVLRVMAEAGLEAVDVENLRPHYARTLWAWSDALEARLAEARRLTNDKVVRAYRLYLAGSAMAFEHGWISLHQMLAVRPDGDPRHGALPGTQSGYPFNRRYIYA